MSAVYHSLAIRPSHSSPLRLLRNAYPSLYIIHIHNAPVKNNNSIMKKGRSFAYIVIKDMYNQVKSFVHKPNPAQSRPPEPSSPHTPTATIPYPSLVHGRAERDGGTTKAIKPTMNPVPTPPKSASNAEGRREMREDFTLRCVFVSKTSAT